MEKIYVTKDELQSYKQMIDNLLVNLGRIEEKISLKRKEDPKSSSIDELVYFRNNIKSKIEEKRLKLKSMVIIEKTNETSYADVGDVVKLKTHYLDGIEEEICQLTLEESDLDTEPEKVSIDSPKGQAIYKTNIGESDFFELGNNKIKVEVLEKIDIKTLKKNI